MLDRIALLLDADRRMSAAIAHELRRPLSHAVQRLEEAESDTGLDGKNEAIARSIVDIRDALDTFQAILRIGEIEAGRLRAAFHDVDLAAIAAQVVEVFRPAAEEEGRKLSLEVKTPLPLKGDERLLTQMVANVLDNAFRHTRHGVAIDMRCEAEGNSLRLIIADHGLGVKPEELSRLFERFYRGDGSRSLPGSGLGLSLVAAIAALHGLTCEARNLAPGLAIVIERNPKD
jgi:signal transduction histidine kinase